MKMEILPKDFIINPTFDVASSHQSDFAVKAIRFINDSDTSIELIKLTYEVIAGGQIVREITCPEDALSERLVSGSEIIKNFDAWG